MRERAIYRRFPALGCNLVACLLLTLLLFGCKDKSEEVSSEQKKEIAVKEQNQEAGATGARPVEHCRAHRTGSDADPVAVHLRRKPGDPGLHVLAGPGDHWHRSARGKAERQHSPRLRRSYPIGKR